MREDGSQTFSSMLLMNGLLDIVRVTFAEDASV